VLEEAELYEEGQGALGVYDSLDEVERALVVSFEGV
jgi:hypothetical protein